MALGTRADEKEWSALVGYTAGVSHYRLPVQGSGSATSYAGGIDVTSYYGITSTLHLGARFRATSSSDVLFGGAHVANGGGSSSRGDVYVDHRAIGLGGIVAYRVDSGLSLAPVLELGVGIALHQARNVTQLTPDGFGVPLEGTSDLALYGSGALLLDYRWRNRWLASAGLMVQAEPGGPTPWSFFVPMRVGYIWW